MKRIISVLFALALVLAFSLMSTTPVAAATPIYVDASRLDDTGDGTSWATAKKYIQSGVSIVDVGGTVMVAAGTYDEQVVITQSLTLIGAGNTTIIQPSAASILTSLYTLGTTGMWSNDGNNLAGIISVSGVGTNGVTVKNLKVDGANVISLPAGAHYVAGISYAETSGMIDSVTVVNVVNLPVGTGYGIWLDGVSTAVSVEVKNSNVDNYNKRGIFARGANITCDIHDNAVIGLGPSGTHLNSGIYVAGCAAATVMDNTIEDNIWTLINNTAYGVVIYHTNATLTGNSINNNEGGIAFCSYTNAIGSWTCTVEDNTIDARGVLPAPTGGVGGIYVVPFSATSSLTAIITNNRLLGGPGAGICVGDYWGVFGAAGTVDATIQNNNISNWEFNGIELCGQLGSADITCNTITNNLLRPALDAGSITGGVYIKSGVDATKIDVHYNNINDNDDYGIYNGDTSILDAANNWWGATSGPYHPPSNPTGAGDDVTDGVTFSPWLGEALASTKSATPYGGTGTAYFTADQGNILGLTGVPTPVSPPVTLPYGMFNFTICCIPSGGSTTLTVTLPGPVPAGTRWYKYIGGSWYSLPIGGAGTSVITVTLQDGAFPDDEDSVSGQITDQGGPGHGAVGWETYPVSKVRVLLPWIALLAAIMGGASLLVIKRRRARSQARCSG